MFSYEYALVRSPRRIDPEGTTNLDDINALLRDNPVHGYFATSVDKSSKTDIPRTSDPVLRLKRMF